MIYINFVELHCLLLHAKLQNHGPSGSGEEDFQRFLLFDSSSLTNEKDHHYFLNSADGCW